MALQAGEVLSGGVVRDASGRQVVAVDPSSSVVVPGSVFTGALVGGTGDNQSYGGATTVGQSFQSYAGTAAAPDTALNPLVKGSRTVNLQAAAVAGDAVEQASVGGGIVTGTAANQVQTVGWYGIATNQGSSKGATDSPDACGLYGVGRVFSGSVGVGIGGFFRGQSDTSTGIFSAVQVQSYNGRGVNDTPNTTGFSNSMGEWVWADGGSTSAVGLGFGNPFGRQFHTGIHFNAQVANALTGPTATNDILSESNATNGIVIKGSKTVGLAIAAGAGYAVVGGTARVTGSALLEVQGGSGTSVDPLVMLGSSTNNTGYTVRIRTSSAQHAWVIAHAANDFFTGTAQGDAGMWIPAAGNAFHIAGTSSVIKVKGDNTLGFFNVATVAQQGAAANTATVAAGATISVFTNTSFSGGVGTTGYTIGDIVRVLKNYGLAAL